MEIWEHSDADTNESKLQIMILIHFLVLKMSVANGPKPKRYKTKKSKKSYLRGQKQKIFGSLAKKTS